MRTFILALAISAVFVTPAYANEGRAEVRGGVAWDAGDEEAFVGAAVGYDFDVGSSVFIGVEGSADKVLQDGADVIWGASARLGAKLGAGKLYAVGGYSFDGADGPHLGAGYEHKLGSNVYVKAEYRHFFEDFGDADAVGVGLGLTF
jgi:hypothetical protein